MKNKLFSRIISIGIVLCMAVAMLPTTFAADDGTGYTIVYDFIDNYQEGVPYTMSETNFFTYKGINEVEIYEKSNGFWKFDAMEGNLSVNHCYSLTEPRKNGLYAYFGEGRTWFSIKINVPVADTYDVILGYDSDNNFDTECQVYILDSGVSADDIATSISDKTNLIGSVNCKSGKQDGTQKTTLGTKELSAGEHTVVFHAANAKHIRIHDFSLSSGEDTVLMMATASASKTELDPTIDGDSAGIFVSSVMYSDKTSKTSGISASDFAYISRDESRATVDANGIVTVNPAALDGEVSVDIVAKDNNEYVLDTVVFTVAASGCSDTKIIYDFKSNYSSDVPYTESEKGFFTASANLVDTYGKTNGFWKFALLDGSLWVNREYNESDHSNDGYIIYWSGEWFAIKIRVPVSDIYSTSVGYNANSKFEKNLEVYLMDGNADNAAVAASIASGENKLGTVDCTQGKYDGTQKKTLASRKLDAGEYLVVFRAPSKTYLRLYEFALTAGNGGVTVPMSAELSLSDEAASVTKVYMSDTSSVSEPDEMMVSYASSNETVATVDKSTGAIEKLSDGDTEISATVTKNGVSVIVKKPLTVMGISNAPGEAVTDIMVNFRAAAETDAAGSVSNSSIQEVEIGNEVTVKATEKEGYKFVYWRNSSGKYLSSNAEETFKVNTNTSVIAVFDKIVEEEDKTTVYFYNENGSFLEKVDTEKNKPFKDIKIANPKLTGHTFANWSIADNTIINSITRAVALYSKDTTELKVTVDGDVKASGKYGDKVSVTGGDDFVAWKLGENVISYDKEYSFYIWGDITLTEVTEGTVEDAAPTVAINKQNDSYFIAYNVPTGYTLIEAGIVFAERGVPTIRNFYSKAAAEKMTGQFTAKPAKEEGIARGYVMFRDNSDNSVRVIYAD